MYLRRLRIYTPSNEIRNIEFHDGLNLIIDQTPVNTTGTGNNVGKTTLLRLIDYCLGGDLKGIYKNPENKAGLYAEVKDFLEKRDVYVELELVDNLECPKRSVKIVRDFKSGAGKLFTINGTPVPLDKKKMGKMLAGELFQSPEMESPTFRQMISHNIRITNDRLENTLNTIHMGKKEDYEALYLFMFGCPNKDAANKAKISAEISAEKKFKKRLEREHTKNEYKVALQSMDSELNELTRLKNGLNINKDLEKDIDELDSVRVSMNRLSSEISLLRLRKELIEETLEGFDKQRFNNDAPWLEAIYKQAESFIPKMQRTFNELVSYHNSMIDSKKKFLSEDLPSVLENISTKEKQLSTLKEKEEKLAESIRKSNTYDELENIISRISEASRRKGIYESYVNQIEDVESSIKEKSKELEEIDSGLFANEFTSRLEEQLKKFNAIFSNISEIIYGEKYAVVFETDESDGKCVYEFHTVNPNFSSGKKQGEISCFDIAYTVFADNEGIPCLHFVLNDKKELMHDNQLVKLAEVVFDRKVQFVVSMLYDKLPEALKKDEYYILKLSQEDKLFRIENNK